MNNQREAEGETLGWTAGCLAGYLGELLVVVGALYYGMFLQPTMGNPHSWDISAGLGRTLLYMTAAGLAWFLLRGLLFWGRRLLGRKKYRGHSSSWPTGNSVLNGIQLSATPRAYRLALTKAHSGPS